VWNNTSASNKDLENFYKSFLKERSKIENDYAKDLRNLIKKYTPRENTRGRRKGEPPEKESTQSICFRKYLQELGFQAGQHELISENITQDQIKEIDSRVKEVRIDLAKQKDEEKILEGDLKRSLKAFYDSEGEYHKSHNDLEANKQSLERAESDGSFTRNEVEKLKLLVQSKTRHYDDTKGQYANQLMKTNKMQEEHFTTLLPNVLDRIQNLKEGNCNFLKEILLSCLKFERGVAPIIGKCYEGMESAIQSIDATTDSELVINKWVNGFGNGFHNFCYLQTKNWKLASIRIRVH